MDTLENIIVILSLVTGLLFLAEYLHRCIFGFSLMCRLGIHRVQAHWMDDHKGNSGWLMDCSRKGCFWKESEYD